MYTSKTTILAIMQEKGYNTRIHVGKGHQYLTQLQVSCSTALTSLDDFKAISMCNCLLEFKKPKFIPLQIN